MGVTPLFAAATSRRAFWGLERTQRNSLPGVCSSPGPCVPSSPGGAFHRGKRSLTQGPEDYWSGRSLRCPGNAHVALSIWHPPPPKARVGRWPWHSQAEGQQGLWVREAGQHLPSSLGSVTLGWGPSEKVGGGEALGSLCAWSHLPPHFCPEPLPGWAPPFRPY